MKNILYIILFLSISYTQTNVAGVVSGTWDSDGSPYLVIGDVIITESLSIEEGVEVIYQGDYNINVFGNLNATGTEENLIKFTGYFDGSSTSSPIIFMEGSLSSGFTYCVFENHYGGSGSIDPVSGAITSEPNPFLYSDNTQPSTELRISNCSFSNITLPIKTKDAHLLGIYNSYFTSYSDISQLKSVFFIITEVSNVELLGNIFIYENGSNSHVHTIHIDGGLADDGGALVIQDNVFQRVDDGNSVTALYIDCNNNCDGFFAYIINNSFYDFWTSIYGLGNYWNGYPHIINNNLFDNTIVGGQNSNVYSNTFHNAELHLGNSNVYRNLFYCDEDYCGNSNSGAIRLSLSQGSNIDDNTISGYYNGIYGQTEGSYQYNIRNNSITGNRYGFNQYCEMSGVSYNNSWGNVLGDYPDGYIQDNLNANNNLCDESFNISEDPQYVSPEDGNFYLLPNSPNIDAGDPESDLDEDGSIADIGLYPYDGSIEFVYGCTDLQANNYDPQANVDDGSCEYDTWGCTNASACNYNSEATIDNGNCYYENMYYEDTDGDNLGSGAGVLFCPEDAPEGWVDNDDDQYPNCNSNVVDECGVCNGDSSSCAGCTDPEASNYDPDATFDDGSCYYEPDVFGCMYSNATNYNPDANVDDGSCIFEDCEECEDCEDDEPLVHLSITNVNISAGTLDIYMENDVPVAGIGFYLSGMTVTNLSDGIINEYFDFVDFNSNNLIMGVSISGNLIPAGEGILVTVSFTDYDNDDICFMEHLTCYIDGDIDYNLSGAYSFQGECWDAGGIFSYQEIVSQEAELIESEWGDCYTPSGVLGCTYPEATNYNPEATDDDGSCEYLWGDINHDGELNMLDLVTIVNAILSGDWF